MSLWMNWCEEWLRCQGITFDYNAENEAQYNNVRSGSYTKWYVSWQYNWIYFPIKIEMETHFKEANVDSSWSQVRRNAIGTAPIVAIPRKPFHWKYKFSKIFCSFNIFLLLSHSFHIPSVWQISSFFSFFLFILHFVWSGVIDCVEPELIDARRSYSIL